MNDIVKLYSGIEPIDIGLREENITAFENGVKILSGEPFVYNGFFTDIKIKNMESGQRVQAVTQQTEMESLAERIGEFKGELSVTVDNVFALLRRLREYSPEEDNRKEPGIPVAAGLLPGINSDITVMNGKLQYLKDIVNHYNKVI